MTFRIENPTGKNVAREVIYSRPDYAFDVVPKPGAATLAVSLNELELMVDEHSCEVVGVRGYCPLVNELTDAELRPPESRAGSLFAVSCERLIPGVVQPLVSGRWPVRFDRSTGWIRIGEGGGGRATVFIGGAVAVVKEDQLVSLYLRPVMVDR